MTMVPQPPMPGDPGKASSDFPEANEGFRIELEDVPPLSPKPPLAEVRRAEEREVARIAPVPMVLVHELIQEDEERLAEAEEAHPTLWQRLKRRVRGGYFNPFQAFKRGADGGKLARGQAWLFVASVLTPFLAMLLLSVVGAGLYHLGALVNGSTPPNHFHEAAFFPLVFIFARGSWLAYLVLPVLLMLGAGLWAALTAWNLSRDSQVGFGPLFCILAMTGAMLAPFTLFPVLRLLVFGLILLFLARRLKAYHGFSYGRQLARGGVFLLVLGVGFGVLERKVETLYASSAELGSTMQAYYFSHRKLVWPSLKVRIPSPNAILLDQLGSLDPDIRGKATERALKLLNSGVESAENRFAMALRMAEFGHPTGMVFAARAYRSGQGVAANPAQALAWMSKASQAEPEQLDYALEEAALYFTNNRALDGKRRFVAIAKRNMGVMHKVLEALKRIGCVPDKNLLWEVQDLYRIDASRIETNMEYTYDHDSGRYGYRPVLRMSPREKLLSRLNEAGPDQWFLLALATECGSTLPASVQVYGEGNSESAKAELQARIATNDPLALDQAGDQASEAGELDKARDYWKRATLALNGDMRRTNAAIYLKLARSYAAAPPRERGSAEAIRGYLGFLALNDGSTDSHRSILQTLKGLGVPVREDMDVSGLEFLSLCARYDLPEAWVILGSSYASGRFPKNAAKAKECLEKAKQLGYQGPAVQNP